MRRLFFIYAFAGFCTVGFGRSPAGPDQYRVYLFLLEDCKITQAYTDKLSVRTRRATQSGGDLPRTGGCALLHSTQQIRHHTAYDGGRLFF